MSHVHGNVAWHIVEYNHGRAPARWKEERLYWRYPAEQQNWNLTDMSLHCHEHDYMYPQLFSLLTTVMDLDFNHLLDDHLSRMSGTRTALPFLPQQQAHAESRLRKDWSLYSYTVSTLKRWLPRSSLNIKQPRPDFPKHYLNPCLATQLLWNRRQQYQSSTNSRPSCLLTVETVIAGVSGSPPRPQAVRTRKNFASDYHVVKVPYQLNAGLHQLNTSSNTWCPIFNNFISARFLRRDFKNHVDGNRPLCSRMLII